MTEIDDMPSGMIIQARVHGQPMYRTLVRSGAWFVDVMNRILVAPEDVDPSTVRDITPPPTVEAIAAIAAVQPPTREQITDAIEETFSRIDTERFHAGVGSMTSIVDVTMRYEQAVKAAVLALLSQPSPSTPSAEPVRIPINPEPLKELADRVFQDADELIDSDPIQLRELAYSAARLLHTVAATIRDVTPPPALPTEKGVLS